jgi:1-aminocyclopropane-1-carboxylate deaminase/D-cysteine desulfhydrase-like pyridoxal-dependent ACC family enzyme
MNIVARVGAKLGIPTAVHCPRGPDTPELAEAKHWGMDVVVERVGYNSVIVRRAIDDAAARGWTYIPFGMECATVKQTMGTQVSNIPKGCQRIVIPVGSGMSLAGLLHSTDLPILGVRVGADPAKRLDKWAPAHWRDKVTLVDAGLDYHKAASVTSYHGVNLDPIYEAKCIKFLQPDDLFWVVGIRSSSVKRGITIKVERNGR